MLKERALAAVEEKIDEAIFPTKGNHVYDMLKANIVSMIEANVEGGTVGIEYSPFPKVFIVTYAYQLPLPVSLQLSTLRCGYLHVKFTVSLDYALLSLVDQVKTIISDITKIRKWADMNQRDQWDTLTNKEA